VSEGHGAAVGIDRVDQLEHAHGLARRQGNGDRENRSVRVGPVVERRTKVPGGIESGAANVGDIDDLAGERDIAGDAVRVHVQRQALQAAA
jgi:hypothetical protein